MMRKWTRLGSPQTILLLVSLCLNVLMGSYIAKQWAIDAKSHVHLAS